jgi:hypothetical protein
LISILPVLDDVSLREFIAPSLCFKPVNDTERQADDERPHPNASSVTSTARLGSKWQTPSRFTDRTTKGKAGRTAEKSPGLIRYSASFTKDISELLDRAGKLGLESLIGKRARSPVARFRFSVIGTLLARRAILP